LKFWLRPPAAFVSANFSTPRSLKSLKISAWFSLYCYLIGKAQADASYPS
jgi:hypothetical protein